MSVAERIDGPSLSGNVIPSHHIHLLPAQTLVPAPRHDPKPAEVVKEPRITVIKEGDKVRTIEVVCACGEVIHLDCEY